MFFREKVHFHFFTTINLPAVTTIGFPLELHWAAVLLNRMSFWSSGSGVCSFYNAQSHFYLCPTKYNKFTATRVTWPFKKRIMYFFLGMPEELCRSFLRTNILFLFKSYIHTAAWSDPMQIFCQIGFSLSWSFTLRNIYNLYVSCSVNGKQPFCSIWAR